MGYSIWTVVGEMRLVSEHEADALAEIKRWAVVVTGGAVRLKLRRALTLDDALDPLFDELPQLFAGIARFVSAGSELELKGEEGERYCYRFDGRRCRHEVL